MRDRTAGFLDHILGGVARGVRLQHHVAQAGGQHAAERRILFERVDHFRRGAALLRGGQRFIIEPGGQDPAALEGKKTFDDQRQRQDRGQQQRPDRPAGRLNDGKQLDPRDRQPSKETPTSWSACLEARQQAAHSGIALKNQAQLYPAACRAASDGRAGCLGRASDPADVARNFPQGAGTVLWIDCGKPPDKRCKCLIRKRKPGAAQKLCRPARNARDACRTPGERRV
ncbi:hypothetical protein D3C81_1327930 [compost metagenome]